MTELVLTPKSSSINSQHQSSTIQLTSSFAKVGTLSMSVLDGETVMCRAHVTQTGSSGSKAVNLKLRSTDGTIESPVVNDNVDDEIAVLAVKNESGATKTFELYGQEIVTGDRQIQVVERTMAKAPFTNVSDLYFRAQVDSLSIIELGQAVNTIQDTATARTVTSLQGITSNNETSFSSYDFNCVISRFIFSNNLGSCLFDFDGSYVGVSP